MLKQNFLSRLLYSVASSADASLLQESAHGVVVFERASQLAFHRKKGLHVDSDVCHQLPSNPAKMQRRKIVQSGQTAFEPVEDIRS